MSVESKWTIEQKGILVQYLHSKVKWVIMGILHGRAVVK